MWRFHINVAVGRLKCVTDKGARCDKVELKATPQHPDARARSTQENAETTIDNII